MLILSRKAGEEIKIETPEGKAVELTVLSIKGNRVRLGFNADDDVHILRDDAIRTSQKTDPSEKLA